MNRCARVAACLSAAVVFTLSGTIAPAFPLAAPMVSEPTMNALTPQESAEGWKLLFDGVSTKGWTTLGSPTAWRAQDGILFSGEPGRGAWLRTERMYRDFELVLEFNLPKGGNSGVGIRGSTHGDPAFTGMEVQIFDSAGQEVSDRICGAVYEAIAPSANAVNPPGEWNSYRIRLVGDTLNVWLNGVQIHTDQKIDGRGYYRTPDQPLPMNTRTTTGFIALQDHGEKEPVRFRNVKIRDLSPDPEPPGFVQLFNGSSTEGFFAKGGGTWTAESGTLVGRDGPGHLFTNGTFGDVEIRALVRVNTRGNSGLYFRTVPNADNPDTWPTGYEAQVDNHDARNFTGCIYDRAHPATVKAPITRDEAWFDYRVVAQGDRIRTWINGVPMVDSTLTNFQEGHIALQTHHQGNVIMYRDLRVRTLAPGEVVP